MYKNCKYEIKKVQGEGRFAACSSLMALVSWILLDVLLIFLVAVSFVASP